MVPRVLMVRRDLELDEPDLDEPVVDEIEPAIAPDGDTALAMLRREHFDAVLVDLALALAPERRSRGSSKCFRCLVGRRHPVRVTHSECTTPVNFA